LIASSRFENFKKPNPLIIFGFLSCFGRLISVISPNFEKAFRICFSLHLFKKRKGKEKKRKEKMRKND